ncbi:MAG TPA: DUF3857 and transglutaminase domain-containing protein [Blastocatellia bacterium]|nr:DUF3857 and transglutaminase domain-containing protein [Blastocatellia bacterium]
MLLRASLTILFMLVLSLSIQAAPASSDWKPVKPDELALTPEAIGQPGADAAILFREGVLADEGDTGTALRMYVRIKIFTDAGRRYADVQLPYRLDLGKIADVRARTIRPDGSVASVEGRDIFDKLLLTTAHSVWRAKTFSLPSVVPGSIIEYRYRQTYPAGFKYFELDLQSDLFIKQLAYRIMPDRASALDLKWITFNAADPSRFAPKWDGAYTITASDILPFRRESLMPPERAVKMWGWLYYSKDTETDPAKYWRKYGQDEYEREVSEARPSKLIRRILDAILLPDDPPDRKASKIYSYIQSEIRNVSRSDIQTWKLVRNKDSDETLRRRYGTPHDINRLLISMLRAAGVDARAAELATRDENFFHSSFADAIQFDSEVTAVRESDGKFKFFDPGTRFCPEGMLGWEKEGVQALVLDKDQPQFVETPVAPGSANRLARQMMVFVQADGSLRVDAIETLTGHKAMDIRASLAAISSEAQRGLIIQSIRELIPGAAVDEGSVRIKGLEQASGTVELSCSFTAPSFAPPTQTRLLLRPGLLERKDESLFQATQRINPVYFPYPWSETDHTTIEMPAGYSPEQLPEDVTLDDGALKYKSRDTLIDGNVICDRDLVVDGFFFKESEYLTLKGFLDQTLQEDRKVISLRR